MELVNFDCAVSEYLHDSSMIVFHVCAIGMLEFTTIQERIQPHPAANSQRRIKDRCALQVQVGPYLLYIFLPFSEVYPHKKTLYKASTYKSCKCIYSKVVYI